MYKNNVLIHFELTHILKQSLSNVRISHFYVHESIRVPTVLTMTSENNAKNHATPAKVHTYIIDTSVIQKVKCWS